jgi:hypothetical protein
MAIHLGELAGVRGSLNLYGMTREGIDAEAPGVAALFATHATSTLGHARQEEQISTALATRKVIGQALGIVMERYQVSEERAFSFLIRMSSATDVKLRDLAQVLVEQTDEAHASGDVW